MSVIMLALIDWQLCVVEFFFTPKVKRKRYFKVKIQTSVMHNTHVAPFNVFTSINITSLAITSLGNKIRRVCKVGMHYTCTQHLWPPSEHVTIFIAFPFSVVLSEEAQLSVCKFKFIN